MAKKKQSIFKVGRDARSGQFITVKEARRKKRTRLWKRLKRRYSSSLIFSMV